MASNASSRELGINIVVNKAGLQVNGDRCSVINRPTHRVFIQDPAGIEGIAEEPVGVAFSIDNWSSSKAEELRVWQGSAQVFPQGAILCPVSLIDKNNDIFSVIEGRTFRELKDCGYYYSSVILRQNLPQVFT